MSECPSCLAFLQGARYGYWLLLYAGICRGPIQSWVAQCSGQVRAPPQQKPNHQGLSISVKLICEGQGLHKKADSCFHRPCNHCVKLKPCRQNPNHRQIQNFSPEAFCFTVEHMLMWYWGGTRSPLRQLLSRLWAEMLATSTSTSWTRKWQWCTWLANTLTCLPCERFSTPSTTSTSSQVFPQL